MAELMAVRWADWLEILSVEMKAEYWGDTMAVMSASPMVVATALRLAGSSAKLMAERKAEQTVDGRAVTKALMMAANWAVARAEKKAVLKVAPKAAMWAGTKVTQTVAWTVVMRAVSWESWKVALKVDHWVARMAAVTELSLADWWAMQKAES